MSQFVKDQFPDYPWLGPVLFWLFVALLIAALLAFGVEKGWIRPPQGWLFQWPIRRARHGTSAPTSVFCLPCWETGFYVGDMSADLTHLHENFIEVAIRGFNATGQALRFTKVRGHILLDLCTDAPPTTLPTPRILEERTDSSKVPNLKEFLVVLEQRVPAREASAISSLLSSGQTVTLNFEKLQLTREAVIADPEVPALNADLWSEMTIRRVGNHTMVERTVKLVALVDPEPATPPIAESGRQSPLSV